MALVYINRVTAMNQILLTHINWRSIWLVVIMLAQKVWDDRPLRTSDFVRLLPDIDSKILRELEYQALTMLKYITGVKPSLYAKYYFELRQLYSDIMGSNPTVCGEWALEPLSNYLASKLDMKNQKLEENRLKMIARGGAGGSSAFSSSAVTPITPARGTSSTSTVAMGKEMKETSSTPGRSGLDEDGEEGSKFSHSDKKSSGGEHRSHGAGRYASSKSEGKYDSDDDDADWKK
jgi:hypothetical protein